MAREQEQNTRHDFTPRENLKTEGAKANHTGGAGSLGADGLREEINNDPPPPVDRSITPRVREEPSKNLPPHYTAAARRQECTRESENNKIQKKILVSQGGGLSENPN